MDKLQQLIFGSGLALFCLLLPLAAASSSAVDRAQAPPRGWNSYDSYSWIISEKDFLANVEVAAQQLLAHGYEYMVVDYLWFRRLDGNSSATTPGYDIVDQWGRPQPDPNRWPSSAGGAGFKPVADKVHQLGLKFGIHVMAGLSQQAYDANTPILGQDGQQFEDQGKLWTVRDIGYPNQTCPWMLNCFMSVNTALPATRAFFLSLYQQFEEWGVDLVKNDCIFGDNFDESQIVMVSEVLQNISRPIVYSLSPGVSATPEMASKVNSLVNMYRVTGDDWDRWQFLVPHFNAARDFAGLIGAQGLHGNSWPDLDMLPIGWLTDPALKRGPYRNTYLSLEEQKAQVTLWCMAKSPLMFGGDMQKLDQQTLQVITQPTLLAINAYSTNNQQVTGLSVNETLVRVWSATGTTGETYVAIFNLADDNYQIPNTLIEQLQSKNLLGVTKLACEYTDVWGGAQMNGMPTSLSATSMPPHSTLLVSVFCKNNKHHQNTPLAGALNFPPKHQENTPPAGALNLPPKIRS